jgi:hypothetical protein
MGITAVAMTSPQQRLCQRTPSSGDNRKHMFMKRLFFRFDRNRRPAAKSGGFSQYAIRKLQKLGGSFAFCTTTWANRVVTASGTRTGELEIFFF